MTERQVTYRVNVAADLNRARSEVQRLRAMVQAEARSGNFQFLDASSFKAATTEITNLRQQFDGVLSTAQQTAAAVRGIKVPTVSAPAPAQQATGGIPGLGALGGAVGNVTGLLGAGIAGYSVARIAGEIQDLAALGTQANRAEFAFEHLSGSAEKAAERVRAIQRAAGGTVTSLEATQYATQAVSLHLAETTAEFTRLTVAARAVALVSPIIHDVGNAISEIGLASANTSYRRLDQLGLSVTETKDRMAELRAENSALSESAAFQEAVVGLLNEKYGGIVTSSVAAATGQELLTTRLKEMRIELGKLVAENTEPFFNRMALLLGGGSSTSLDNALTERLKRIQEANAENQRIQEQFGGFGDILTFNPLTDGPKTGLADALEKGLADALGVIEDYSGPLKEGIAGLRESLENEEIGIPDIKSDQIEGIQELQSVLRQASEDLKEGLPGADAFLEGIEGIASGVAQFGAITDQQIEDLHRLEEAYASGALATEENSEAQAKATEAQAAALADLESAAGRIQELFANISAAQAAGIPGADQYAASLANIAQSIALAGSVSDEHSAALAEIDQWYTLAAGSAETLSMSNSTLEASQMGAANASYMLAGGLGALPGWLSVIEGGSYSTAAGVDTLTGSLYSLSVQMAQLTAVRSQIGSSLTSQAKSLVGIVGADNAYKLLQRQQSQVGGAVSQLQAQGYTGDALTLKTEEVVQQLAAPFEAIKEAEKERIRSAQQAEREAARETAGGFKKAAKATEDEFKKAAKQLRSDLSSVPGLFGLSDVTEDQMEAAKAGLPQNFADNYVRRLRDEVEHGTDWADVSIEDAARRIGYDPNLPAELILKEFENQWRSGALFADKANLELIDRDAVNAALEMKEKARQGQENIYEYFGAVMDDAVDAATGGGGGGGARGGGGIAPLAASVIDGIHNDLAKELQGMLGEPLTGLNIEPLTGLAQQVNQMNGFLSSFSNPFGQGGQFPAGQFPYGPMPKPGTPGEKAEMKVDDYFAFPVPEQKIALTVSDYWEMQQPKEVDLAALVSVTGELPEAVKIDRAKLVQYINDIPVAFKVDKATLIDFINELPAEKVNREELVAFINDLPGEEVDRAGLVAFINELPPSLEVDREELVAFINELPPAEQVDRSSLVNFIGNLPIFDLDLGKIFNITGSVPTLDEALDGATTGGGAGGYSSSGLRNAGGGGRRGFLSAEDTAVIEGHTAALNGSVNTWGGVTERLTGLMGVGGAEKSKESMKLPVTPDLGEGGVFADTLRSQIEAQSGEFTEIGKIPAKYMQGGYQSYEWGELGRSFIGALSNQLTTEQAVGTYRAIGEFAATNVMGGYASAIGSASFLGPLKAKIAAEIMNSIGDAVEPAPTEKR